MFFAHAHKWTIVCTGEIARGEAECYFYSSTSYHECYLSKIPQKSMLKIFFKTEVDSKSLASFPGSWRVGRKREPAWYRLFAHALRGFHFDYQVTAAFCLTYITVEHIRTQMELIKFSPTHCSGPLSSNVVYVLLNTDPFWSLRTASKKIYTMSYNSQPSICVALSLTKRIERHGNRTDKTASWSTAGERVAVIRYSHSQSY